MSDPGGQPTPPPGAPPPGQRSGCLTAFMFVAGIILMLPGLCAIILAADSFPRFDASLSLIILLCLVVGSVGLLLTISAARGR